MTGLFPAGTIAAVGPSADSPAPGADPDPGTACGPAPFLVRRALLERVAGQRIVVAEAAAGFGKTTLTLQIRDRFAGPAVVLAATAGDADPPALLASLRRAARAGGLSDLAATIDPGAASGEAERFLDMLANMPDPVLFIVDDIHELGPGALALMTSIVSALPAPHRAVLAGRRVPAEPWPGPRAVRLTAAALAYTPGELAELLERRSGARPGPGTVRAALACTGGWPTLAALLPFGTGSAAASSGRLKELVDAMLTRFGAADRRVAVQLAHLTPFSARVADAVAGGPETIDRLTVHGLPLARAAGGDWDIPGPIAARLASLGPLTLDVVAAVAEVLVAERRADVAVRLLLQAGDHDAAAAVLAGLAPDVAGDIGIGVLDSLTGQLPDEAVAARPAVLLRLAQLGDTDSAGIRDRAIARLDRILAGSPDAVARRELDAERARDLIWDETTRPQAARLAAEVLRTAGPDEVAARARALDVAGRCASWYLPYQPDEDAGPMLEESARLAIALNRPVWAVQALVPLALGVHAARGEFDAALRTLQAAQEHLPFRSRTRATVLSFQADLLAGLGRFDEGLAVVAEAREIGEGLGDERILAYASWSEAILMSYARDRDQTIRAVLDVERHRGAWFGTEAGSEFLAYAAYLLDRVGEAAMARHYLQRAHGRGLPTRIVTQLFEAQVIARSGDPAEAERLLVAALGAAALEPRERPYLMLMRAYAALRGSDPAARQLAADAFDTLLTLGNLQAAWVREPDVIQRLLALGGGCAGATALAAARGYLRVQTFGRFRIHRDGVLVPLPPGRPSLAVRAVAARHGRMRADALIELLWPDSPPGAGRNRLRNLLSRIRATAGDVLVRDGDAVALPAGSEIDAEQFHEHVRAALAAGAAGGSRARSAMALYHGDFLPEDLDGWADEPRQRCRREYLMMLDIVAASALRHGEIDEALRLTERAIEVEPLDEARYVALADLLTAHGRRGSALSALRRAAAVLHSMDIEPSAALRDRLRGVPVRGRSLEPGSAGQPARVS